MQVKGEHIEPKSSNVHLSHLGGGVQCFHQVCSGTYEARLQSTYLLVH